MTKIAMQERINQKIQEWKGEIEHLNVQLHLGVKEAQDEFEKQKKHLHEWSEEVKKEVIDIAHFGEDKTKEFQMRLDELRVQAALGRAETRDEIDHQVHNLNLAVHHVKLELSKLLDQSKSQIGEFIESAADTLDKIHTRMDLINLRMHLGKKEVEDEWEEKKVELSHALHDIHVKIDKAKDLTEDKWENFTAEIKEAWKHVKKAILN